VTEEANLNALAEICQEQVELAQEHNQLLTQAATYGNKKKKLLQRTKVE
jgi:hypothetical protein